jgi:hypothetical protein
VLEACIAMNPSTGGGRYAQAPAPEQSHFNQGGTLDWVGLSKTSVSFTVDVLGRFMAAGVSPLTIVVGQEVARRLRLSKVGHEHIQDALQRLQSYRGFGKALWFGFGLRSLPRTLGTTDEGRSLVALCAALGETFHEDIAASVIHHLVANFNAPSGLTPSLEALCTRGKGVESSSESLCLLALLETIITLCQTLSAIFPRDAIQPRRNGLVWFYRRSHLSIQKASTHIGSADDLIRRSDFYRIVELSAQGDILQSAMMYLPVA